MGKHGGLRKEAAVGTIVKKQFYSDNTGQIEWFQGVVTKYTAGRGYLVVYTDGDSEEMSLPVLRQHIVATSGKCVVSSSAVTAPFPRSAAVASEHQHKPAHKKRKVEVQGSEKGQDAAAKRPKRVVESPHSVCDAAMGNSADQNQAVPAPPAAANPSTAKSKKQRLSNPKRTTGRAASAAASTSGADVAISRDVDEAAAASLPAAVEQATAAAAASAGVQPAEASKGRVRMYATKTCSGVAPNHKAQQQQRKDKQKAADAGRKAEQKAAKHKQRKQNQAQTLAHDVFPALSQQQQQKTSKKSKKSTANAASCARPAAVDASNEQEIATADAAACGEASLIKNSRVQKAIINYEPARVLAAAYAVATCAAVSSLKQQDIDEAESVVTTGDGLPLWELKDEEAQVIEEDKHQYLSRTATNFAAGKQPYRAFMHQRTQQLMSLTAGKTAEQLAEDPEVAAAADAAASAVLWVMDQPFADDGAQLACALKQAQLEFWRAYRLATVTEAERVARVQAEQAEQKAAGSTEKFKNPSARPDRVAESQMLTQNFKAINDRDSFGHVPGVNVNNTFNVRSEASVLGVHKSPLGGIVTATIPVPIVVNGKTYKGVRAATSICLSGCYEDDHDSTSTIITYTGEGGNDLLGNKKQIKGQELKRGNKALMANIALGIPVRLLRRNDEKSSAMSSVLFYDGLYYVVSWMKTLGKEGKVVFIFGLRRRQGQEPSLSKPIERFKAVSIAKRGHSELVRENLICRDISKGLEKIPVVVHNEVDRDLPPGLDPITDQEWMCDDRADTAGALKACKEPFTYINTNVYDQHVRPPQPPTVVEEDSAEAVAALLAAEEDETAEQDLNDDTGAAATDDGGHGGGRRGRALRSRSCSSAVSSSTTTRDHAGNNSRSSWLASRSVVIKRAGESPHELLARLNGGNLPYESRLQKGKGERGPVIPVARALARVLVECGDWTGCTDENCQHRQVDQGLRYRLEVFKTKDKGWAVRSWDTIKSGSLVCVMVGKIVRAEDVGDGRLYSDSDYFFDCQPRLEIKRGAELFKEDCREVKHILCAKEQGGVARFINHSCHPNLYVQPLCSGHTDLDLVQIGLFADCNIPPFTELTYDYGSEYIEKQLCGVCLCGMDCCKYKPQQQQ